MVVTISVDGLVADQIRYNLQVLNICDRAIA